MEYITTELGKVGFSDERGILYYVWFSTTSNATWEEMKEDLLSYVSVAEQSKASKHLIDERELFFLWDPKCQEWMNDNSMVRIFNAGCRKVAIVRNSNVISELAVEQLFDEPTGKKMVMSFFDNVADAEAWLSVKV